MPRALPLFLVLVLFIASPALRADAVVWTSSFADFNALDADGNPGNPSVICSQANAPCIGSTVVPNTGLTMTYDAHATAQYGQFNAYGSASLSGTGSTPSGFYSVVQGRSAWQDAITITGAPDGTAGSLLFQFTVTGTNTVSTPGNCVAAASDNCAGAAFNLRLFPAGGGYTDNVFYVDASGLAKSPAIPIIFGQPLNYALWFTAGINIWYFSDGSSATADFSHTATLTEIEVLNADQQPVSNFVIQAESGAEYTSNGIVPEPATFLLAGMAVSGLAILRRRILG